MAADGPPLALLDRPPDEGHEAPETARLARSSTFFRAISLRTGTAKQVKLPAAVAGRLSGTDICITLHEVIASGDGCGCSVSIEPLRARTTAGGDPLIIMSMLGGSPALIEEGLRVWVREKEPHLCIDDFSSKEFADLFALFCRCGAVPGT